MSAINRGFCATNSDAKNMVTLQSQKHQNQNARKCISNQGNNQAVAPNVCFGNWFDFSTESSAFLLLK